MNDVRHIIGCMSGTSLDGLDAAAVLIRGRGVAMRATFLCHASMSLGECESPLRRLAKGVAMTAGEIATAMHDFSLLHASVCEDVWRSARDRHGAPPHPDLICVHGQTVHHRPPVSWQLFQPAPLSHAMNAPVVCDLRQADLAAGGQGAPLTPAADYVLFARPDSPAAIVNLGGFCNLTLIPPRAGGDDPAAHRERIDSLRGGDVCPCNHLLDEIARRALSADFDSNGDMAMQGTVREPLRQDLLSMLRRLAATGRSLGSGDELHEWIGRSLESASPADLAATVASCIASMTAEAIPADSRVLLFGGGARNRRVHAEFASLLGPGRLSDLPMPPEAREAAAWAVLGALAEDGADVSVASITHRMNPARVAGLRTR